MRNSRPARYGKCPPTETLVEMAKTRNASQIARDCGVAASTVRNRLAAVGVRSVPPDWRDRPQSGSPIWQAHNGDIDAIRAEIEATELATLAARYGRKTGSVYKWERAYEARCMRVCTDCKETFPAAQIACRSDGAPTSRCLSCAAEAKGKAPASAHHERVDDEFRGRMIMALRMPLNRASGPLSYWASQGMYMVGEA